MLQSLRSHWPEYAMEGAELGMFMVLASGFATLLYAPSSPVPSVIPNLFLRGMVMGVVMGLCAIAIIYSPWGKRSGAHFNPAVTLAFYHMGKLGHWDALFYVFAQFIGGVLGISFAASVLGESFTNSPVNYIVTVPGSAGWFAALVVESILAFTLMTAVLIVSNHSQLHQYTGVFAGTLVAAFITFAAPISGMSINPARTFASAVPADIWTAFWIYYLAPPLAMLLAVEVYLRRTRSNPKTLCGKLCPTSDAPCICSPCCRDDLPII